MGPSALVRGLPFGAIAAVVLVLLGALLGTTVAGAAAPTQQSTIAARSSIDLTPETVSAGPSGFHSKSSGEECALRCTPECGGPDPDCVALNPTGPLRTAEHSPVLPLPRTGATPARPGVFRQHHRPVVSLLLLSITRI